jgi:hypothetical protein
MRSLEELDMSSCTGEAGWLVQLQGCTKLNALTMGRQYVGNTNMTAVAHFKRLKRLDVMIARGTDEIELVELGALTELQMLRLLCSPEVKELPFIKLLPQLRELYLSAPGIDDQTVAALANSKELRVLRFENCPKLTDKSLEQVGRLKHLHELSLDRTAITDQGLAHLKDLKEMQNLFLDRTAITGSGFGHFKEMKSLRVLSLDCPKVTDGALAGLSNLVSLEVLNLGPRVTDAGLPALYGLKNLRSIYGQKITQAGYIKLMQEVKKAREKP